MPKLKADTRSRWQELLAGAAVEIDRLADSYLEQIMQISPYDSGLVDRDEVHDDARKSLQLILRNTTAPSTTGTDDLPVELGQRRARQGVPVESLVAAVRLCFGVIWSYILWRAHHRDAMALAMHVGNLCGIVDTYARTVQQSYLQEIAIIAREESDHQRGFLLELLRHPHLPSNISRLAAALGTDESASYRVVMALMPEADAIHRAESQARASAEKLFTVEWNSGIVGFWQAPRKSKGPQTELQYRLLSGVRAGFVPQVAGLGKVPSAADSALDIAHVLTADDSGLVTFPQAWARVARRKLEGGADPVDRVTERLDSCGDEERHRIVETVQAFLESGNVGHVATRLYCHRNTVLKRLQRFRELTGLDVTIPQDAALALLALS
ncbi:PucR family transcriptional regulator [Nocardia jiangxiensis]|uniref:PucR family transcriptional regulator n=1 Tax=Nocardia jiangxiensis TaxID=282685 RepID=UPI00146C077B|nr:helix-turn-helix domain-containing protein [Nocardia jiangxiensis]